MQSESVFMGRPISIEVPTRGHRIRTLRFMTVCFRGLSAKTPHCWKLESPLENRFWIVYGIDKIGMPNILKDHPKIVYEQMDAYDPLLLENFSKSKKFDIIIEDGSHVLDDQLRAVFTLAPRLKDDGLMIVEDVMPFDHAEKMVSLINGAEIIDLRANGNDKDDVLVVFKKHDVVAALERL